FDSIHRMPVRTALVQGHRIAYLDAGKGPPVILVHGFGGSMWQWEYQQTALSATHRVITLDLLGGGLSGKPALAYTPAAMVEVVHDPELLTPAVIERSYLNRTRPGLIPPLMTLIRNLPLWEERFARQLAQIRPPTLIVWGAKDRVFPPKVGQDLHAALPGSSFALIPEAGHIPQWEQPDQVNRVLLNFLQP